MSQCDICYRDVDDGVACGDCCGLEEAHAELDQWKSRALAAEARVMALEKAVATYSTGLVVADSAGWQALGELLATVNGKVKP